MDYWTVHHSKASRVGFMCKECKHYINIGEPIAQRDGRRIRLIYHEKCFSGDADPRTQYSSSYHEGKFAKACFQDHAPEHKYGSKPPKETLYFNYKKPSTTNTANTTMDLN